MNRAIRPDNDGDHTGKSRIEASLNTKPLHSWSGVELPGFAS